MKNDRRILYIAFALIFGLSVVLNLLTTFLSFSTIGNKKMPSDELTPHLDIDLDDLSTQEGEMRRKFDIYLFQKSEGGSTIAEIYSKKQVEDINKAKENGVIFSLTTKELIFLLFDTIELFYKNDIVRITDKDGITHEFLGVDYYSSEEYFSNFRGLDIGRTDISYDLNNDIYLTLKARIEVLCSFYQSYYDSTYFIMNATRSLNEDELDFLCSRIEMIDFGYYPSVDEEFKQLTRLPLDGFRFSDGKIKFFHSITQKSPTVHEAFPSGSAPYEAGRHKYDRDGKVVVIEVYRKWSEELVARIRFDSDNDKEIIDKICSTLNRARPYFNYSNGDMPYSLANYRIAVYFNGIPFLHEGARNRAIVFDPDGEPDIFAFTDGDDIFDMKDGYFTNGRELTSYIFELVLDNIHQE